MVDFPLPGADLLDPIRDAIKGGQMILLGDLLSPETRNQLEMLGIIRHSNEDTSQEK